MISLAVRALSSGISVGLCDYSMACTASLLSTSSLPPRGRAILVEQSARPVNWLLRSEPKLNRFASNTGEASLRGIDQSLSLGRAARLVPSICDGHDSLDEARMTAKVDVTLKIPALEQLLNLTASGIGSVAGPMLASWQARKLGEASTADSLSGGGDHSHNKIGEGLAILAGFVYAWGMQEQETPTTIPDLKQVVLRLAQPHERPRWDALMNQHHYLGFKQFAGRGLRYVAEYEGEWLALVGWQTGVFQCRPRDRWLGWHKAVQFRRLHLIANNTRFLVLPEGAGVQHLASRVLGLNLRRLSQDWQQRWGHPIELAETFVDPQLYRGTVYLALPRQNSVRDREIVDIA